MDYYYDGAWRMDWGLDNPNKTAVLIACLMVAIWSLALIWKRGFWIALVIATVLAWCLVQTYSRGGMVALLCGMAVLLAWTPRPWPKMRVIAVTIAVWVLGGMVLWAKAQMRYGQGLFADDQSIDNRLVIWRHGPAMLAAAPWGWANAGDSYTQWFQSVSQPVNYLNLINSHFNFMVESGWLGSVLYLFTWWVVILLCWPTENLRMKTVPLAIWVTFGAGACFSHIANSPWLWLVPLYALACAFGERIRQARWPRTSMVAAGCGASTAAVAVLVVIGKIASPLPIECDRNVITVGSGKDATVIFVDRKVMGSLYGHTFRKYLAKNPEILADNRFIFVESSDDFSTTKSARFVVTGHFAEDRDLMAKLDSEDGLILINPFGILDDSNWHPAPFAKMTVYVGEYSEMSSRAAWSNAPGVRAIQIKGAADFVPSWPEAIWNSTGS